MTGNPKPGMGSANQVLDKIPDNFFPEGTVIMGSEPLAGIELKDMEELAADVTSSEEMRNWKPCGQIRESSVIRTRSTASGRMRRL